MPGEAMHYVFSRILAPWPGLCEWLSRGMVCIDNTITVVLPLLVVRVNLVLNNLFLPSWKIFCQHCSALSSAETRVAETNTVSCHSSRDFTERTAPRSPAGVAAVYCIVGLMR